MSSIVCFDAHVVIWGVRKVASSGQEEMIRKAEHLIKKCEAEGTEMIIPSIVVGELLSGLDDELHTDFINAIYNLFMVVPFDAKAAVVFSRIWRSNRHIQRGNVTRSEMKADYMIVATAKAQGAKCIYSQDADLAKFAIGYIDVEPLPTVPVESRQQDFLELLQKDET